MLLPLSSGLYLFPFLLSLPFSLSSYSSGVKIAGDNPSLPIPGTAPFCSLSPSVEAFFLLQHFDFSSMLGRSLFLLNEKKETNPKSLQEPNDQEENRKRAARIKTRVERSDPFSNGRRGFSICRALNRKSVKKKKIPK